MIFVVDKGDAEKRPKSASDAGSNELPAWKADHQYGALSCFVLKNLQFHAHQFITDFTTKIVKLSRKRRLTRVTHLWVALTYLPFPHRTQSLF